jgi:hypothetical protein
MDSTPIEREITPSSLVAASLKPLLYKFFLSDPSLLILPNLISSNTPIPFL